MSLNPLHADIKCKRQAKIIQLFPKILKIQISIAIFEFSMENELVWKMN